jgi:hypothetical protein
MYVNTSCWVTYMCALCIDDSLVVCMNTGGLRGFDNVLWKVNEYRGGRRPSVKFTYHSFDGEQGESRCDLALSLLTIASMGKKVI